MLKDEIESSLSAYILNHADVSFRAMKISTNVYKNEILQMWIYYRIAEIRITVKVGTPQHAEYESLSKEGLAYQKPNANPYEPGKYSFFVGEKNAINVIDRLLQCNTVPCKSYVEEYCAQAKLSKPVAKANAIPTAKKEAFEQNAGLDHRIEKKLDSLISSIGLMYSEKRNLEEPKDQQKEPIDKRFRIEPANADSPVVFVKGKALITSLIFNLRLCAMGIGTSSERQKLFFINSIGEKISSDQVFEIKAGDEFTYKAELPSSASVEPRLFLVVQGINAKEDEIRQMLEFPVKISFEADFGF